MIFRTLAMAAAIGLSMFTCGPAQAATPYPTNDTPAPQDLGAVTAPAAAELKVTLPLKLRDEAGAEALLQACQKPEVRTSIDS